MPITLSPLDRREFLRRTFKTTFLGAVAASLPSSLRAEAAVAGNAWAFISDTHIGQGNKLGNRQFTQLQSVADDIVSGHAGRASGVIHGGDCAWLRGKPEDYVLFMERMRVFREAGLPVHCVMGNHDNRKAFLEALAKEESRELPGTIPKRVHSVLETPKVNFFLLDSLQRTDFNPGRLGETQIEWLTRELDSQKEKPAVLVAHHNVDFSLDYLQHIPDGRGSIRDLPFLMESIRSRKQVKAYIHGHAHIWKTSVREGIHIVSLPTTSHCFHKDQTPGWVLFDFMDDGVKLTFRSIESEHPFHDRVVELDWRKT